MQSVWRESLEKLTRLVTRDDSVKVFEVIIIVARRAQHLEWQISDDGWRPMIKKEKLPFETVARSEFAFCFDN